jgi:hypothetical protein
MSSIDNASVTLKYSKDGADSDLYSKFSAMDDVVRHLLRMEDASVALQWKVVMTNGGPLFRLRLCDRSSTGCDTVSRFPGRLRIKYLAFLFHFYQGPEMPCRKAEFEICIAVTKMLPR